VLIYIKQIYWFKFVNVIALQGPV